MSEVRQKIPARLESAVKGGYVTGAKDIFDDTLGKAQSVVNEEHEEAISDLQESVGTGGSVDERIAAEKNRASNAEQGLDTRLNVVEQLADISVEGGEIGIATAVDFESDDPSDLAKVPTVSAILGGANDGVYDISARHNGTKYADLTAALGTDGANIPEGLRRGGMSIKFVQSSDNIYEQYRLMSTSFSTSESDWESIDTATKNSQYDFAISDEVGNNIIEVSNGHVKTKNFDSRNINSNADSNHDFAIADEQNNNIVVFNNGHVKTKNFDSRNINSNADSNHDFAISDEVGNNIIEVSNGHVKTKNFDSERETLAIPKTLFKLNHRTNEYVVASGWQTVDDYITNNGNYGWDNKLVIDREITITDKFFVIDFSVGSSAIAYFGSVGSYRTTDSKQSLVSVDFTTGKLNIHYYIPATYSMPNVFKSVSFDNTDYIDKKYRITINRSNMVLKVALFDITTEYKEIAAVSCTFTSTGIPCGHLYDKPMCFSSGADIKIYNFIVAVPLNKPQKCHILIEGDSITGGWSVQNPEEDSYGFMLAKDFPNSMVKVSGRGNGSIRNLIDSVNSTSGRLASEAAILKPDYVMVTIGTNDSDIVSDFPTYLQYLIDYVCDTIGSKLILNHIPESQTFSLAPTMNAMIDSAIENNSSKDILCCKFDVCTAVDFDISKGQDSSLFADGAHPNEKGYIRMYNQVKIDCPELFNY